VNGLGNGRYNTLEAAKFVNPHARKGTEKNTAKLEGLTIDGSGFWKYVRGKPRKAVYKCTMLPGCGARMARLKEFAQKKATTTQHGHHVTTLLTPGFYIVGYTSDINQALHPPGIAGEGLHDYMQHSSWEAWPLPT
jgi:hypothetical protein